MFKKLFNSVHDKYKQMQEESSLYLRLLNTTGTITGLTNVPVINRNEMTISYKEILDICPDLNDNKALLIRGLLPVNEVYLTVMYAKECKTNKEYFLVPTNKYLWVISTFGYVKYLYDDLRVEIVKNNLMSKVLNLSNILLEVNGSEEKISEFIKIINDLNYRSDLSNEKLKKYCGIEPQLSLINDLGTGISMDSEKNFVFHTKNFNYKYNIKDIKNYELLLDDNVVMEKRSNRRIRLTTNKNSCYEMTIRVTTTDKIFILPIITKSTFGEVYQSTSAMFMNGRSFANKIMNFLDEADENMLNVL